MRAGSRLSIGDSVSLPPTVDSVDPGAAVFPGGAYRANLYVYDPFGRIDWYALVPQSFINGRYFTMGRGTDCNIALNDGSVSTRHAYIAAEADALVLRDLESTNGTSLNGARLVEAPLNHGDVIRVGATDIRFLYSYRESPVHLVLDFKAGMNAGKSVATYGASTNVGRLNCAINLQGQGVAAQHVRIDAYGSELLFVVNLHRDNETWLNGQRLTGIAAAREGDVLQIGEHEIVLRVGEPGSLTEGVPQGDGTLLLDSGNEHKAAPVVRMSATDLAKLEAHLLDLPPDPLDRTELDMVALAGTFETQLPQDPPKPLPRKSTASLPEARFVLESGDDSLGDVAAIPEVDWADPADAPPRRSILWLVAPAVVVAIVVAAAMTKTERSLKLGGTVEASSEHPVVSPARARVEHLYFRAGDRVQAKDTLARLVDLEVKAEMDRLATEIKSTEALSRKQGGTQILPVPVPTRLRVAVRSAESDLDAARQAARAMHDAFNRREVGFEALQRARSLEREARQKLEAARAKVSAARRKRRVQVEGPNAELLSELAQMVQRREKLERQLYIDIKAGAPGAIAQPAGEALRTGTAVNSGQTLFRVLDTGRLQMRISVPARNLEALESAKRGQLRPEGFERLLIEVPLGRPGFAICEGPSARWSSARPI